MSAKTRVGPLDQFPVEPGFTPSRFVSRNEKNRLAPRIEGKRYSPGSIRRMDAQFLHIRVAGSIQCIGVWPLQLWPELFEQARHREDFILHLFVQFKKLRFELVAKLDNPRHRQNMTFSPYDVKFILIL